MGKKEYDEGYTNKIKFEARNANLEHYERVTGRSSLPKDQTYWTLSNLQPDKPTTGQYVSEIIQMTSMEFVTKDRFHGIDCENEIIHQNKNWHPEANWYCGDWCEVIRYELAFRTAGFVYLDTTAMAGFDNAVRMLSTTIKVCGRRITPVIAMNVMLNSPYGTQQFDSRKLVEGIKREVPSLLLSAWNKEICTFTYNWTDKTTMQTLIFFRH